MNLITQNYSEQKQIWPASGRHILAQFDSDSIVVYQAYKPSIGEFAARNGTFGGDFSMSRMTWIKPNFLWMMYRSGWGTKTDQEVTLAIRLKRPFWEEILSAAVISSFSEANYASEDEWKRAVGASDVRLQWDPDHHPYGAKQERRAIQLGLRGETLKRFCGDGLIEIQNISSWVEEQRHHVEARQLDKLELPRERPYLPASAKTIAHLKLDIFTEPTD